MRISSLARRSWQSNAVIITLRLARPFQQPIAIVDESTWRGTDDGWPAASNGMKQSESQ